MKRLQRAEARQQFSDSTRPFCCSEFKQTSFNVSSSSTTLRQFSWLGACLHSAMNSGGGGSPFYHCQLCTKAYSSEKSLNKHMRKKHGIGREQQIHRSPSAKPSKASTEETVQSPSKIQVSRPPKAAPKQSQADEDMAIVCPECGGTIKSKKGVAKHYMCFHNIVYSAWKDGWFGRSVRLMDLTQAMIGRFYASGGGALRESLAKCPDAEPGSVPVEMEDEERSQRPESDEDKETDEAVEADAVQLVVDEGHSAEDDEEEEGPLVLDGADEDQQQTSGLSLDSRSVKPAAAVPEAAPIVSISRRRRSKLKTRLAVTSPFFHGKDGKLEFNTNEDPLDINCPFCIVHKTTIKGLAKHCVNHHPEEYSNWKDGSFGNVQLRYIRPSEQQLSDSISCFNSTQVKRNAKKQNQISETKTQQKQLEKPKQLDSQQRAETLPFSPGLNLINLVPCSVCHKMVRRQCLAGHCATQHPEQSDVPPAGPAISVSKVESSPSSRRKSELMSAFDDDKQANPCPFCGELIFSKGMGKHCIYFHNDQYQEWKAGKFGSVPLRFVPSQIAGTADSDWAVDTSGRASKKRDSTMNTGMSIVFPTSEQAPDSWITEAPSTKTHSGRSVTLQIKPSSADQGASIQQTLERKSSSSPSFVLGIKEGINSQGHEDDDENGALLIDCDDESADEGDICDEDAAFTCHYCDATFDTSDELKLHFSQKHIEEGAKATFGDQQDSKQATSKKLISSRCHSSGRFICDICHTPYPSKRSLSQHYRIHKFDRLSSSSSALGGATGSSSTEQRSADIDSRSMEPGELASSLARRTSEAHRPTANLDSKSIQNDPSNGDGRLRMSFNADVLDVAALFTAESKVTSSTADCPKCCKTFSDKWLLLDHMTRCFAEPLSRGKLDAKDLAALAGVEDDADTKSSSPPIEKSHFDYESQKMLNENKEEVYKCRFCDRTFKTSSHIRNHEKFCSNDSTTRVVYACEVCKKQFYMKCHLAVHMKVHKMSLENDPESGAISGKADEKSTQPEKFECKQCEKSFSSSANLLKHKVVHTNSSVRCKTCNREFKMACHLARHFCSALLPGSQQPAVEHSETEEMNNEGNYECDLCHRTFQYAGNLTVHKRFCQQHGTDSSAAPVAILLDAEDEGFECGMCNETFRDKLALEVHASTCRLTDCKPAAVVSAVTFADGYARASQFECRRCPAKFFSRSELLDHMRQHGYTAGDATESKKPAPQQPPPAKKSRLHHSSNAESPLRFQCDLCSSQFSSSLGLVVHKSKCHPDVYGPGHRQRELQQKRKSKNRLIAQILQMPDQRKSVAAGAATQAQAKFDPRVASSAAAQLVITKSGSSKSKPQAPVLPPPGPPLLSLPNRCQHCPRAFLTLSKLNEHLANVHSKAPVGKPAGVAEMSSKVDNDSASPPGGLVLDINSDADDNNSEGTANRPDNDAVLEDAFSAADAYLCTECEKSFPSLDLLGRHLSSAHEIQELYKSRTSVAHSGARKRKSVPMATSYSGTG
uniref:C2H2-type domain-containing protein n=1 Tax=Macrostomum lignano TaxID=282301 RepID=A0A1I8J8I1_9PLAT